ncbi:zinc-binding protein A33-like [Leucoraja erinacea]|uniref:zinc-binding protein A33-like n=1 Tax=Leucoraja erinaceus TaxID=7782 RepID=UPI002457C935|nr:zinc-binding protein A33-like [Leucoraja erinacea]
MEHEQELESLWKEATCSICLDMFREPQTIDCGHNFCRACIVGFWESVEGGEFSCPQCREVFPRQHLRPNRTVSNLTEIIQKLLPMPKDEAVQWDKEEKTQVKSATVSCVGTSPHHTRIPGETVLHHHFNQSPFRQRGGDKLVEALDRFEVTLEELSRSRLEEEASAAKLKRRVVGLTMSIKYEFARLHRFLDDEELILATRLRQREENVSAQIQENLRQNSEEVTAINEISGVLTSTRSVLVHQRRRHGSPRYHRRVLSGRPCGADLGSNHGLHRPRDRRPRAPTFRDASDPRNLPSCYQATESSYHIQRAAAQFLQHFCVPSIFQHLQFLLEHFVYSTAKSPQGMPALKKFSSSLRRQLHNLPVLLALAVSSSNQSTKVSVDLTLGDFCGPTLYTIWKQMLNVINPVPIGLTLDPRTANPFLEVSDDRTEVRLVKERRDVAEHAERFTACLCVLGAETFTAGRHYWQVEVEDNSAWIVGVAKGSIQRKTDITLRPSNGCWAVELFLWRYQALTSPPTHLQPKRNPRRVGVYLDYAAGQVSMCDADDMSHLYTFSDVFTGRLHPFFWTACKDGSLKMAALQV